jgi:hypothetical protein
VIVSCDAARDASRAAPYCKLRHAASAADSTDLVLAPLYVLRREVAKPDELGLARAALVSARQDYDNALFRSVRARTAVDAALAEYADASRDVGQSSMLLIAAEDHLSSLKSPALCRLAECWDVPVRGGMGYCATHQQIHFS